jgi:hypothetical protein
VSAIAKPWEVQHKIAKLVADEFFDQGDLEKLQLNTKPIAMMDRERKDELPKMQVGFIDVICLPLYKVLSETFPWISPLYEETLENRKHWQDLAEKGEILCQIIHVRNKILNGKINFLVEMGLTWIDHDTIDEPIEELAGNYHFLFFICRIFPYYAYFENKLFIAWLTSFLFPPTLFPSYKQNSHYILKLKLLIVVILNSRYVS